MSVGRIAESIAAFARTLRRAGVPVGPASVVDAVRAVEIAGVARRDDVYWALHAVFVTRHDQHAVFDEAFRLFWRRRTGLDGLLAAEQPDRDPEEEKAPAARRRAAEAMLPPAAGVEQPAPERLEIDARSTVSDSEALRRRDFAQMSAAEVHEAERQIAALKLPVDRVATRRFTPARNAAAFDPRRTLRASMRTGGDIILLRHREPRRVEPPLVVICDISGSMAAYTRIFLHFIHALAGQRRVHSFLFGTRLTNITRQLRHKDVDEALAACAGSVLDWSGGTRIATALRAFNRDWSRRVLGQGAVVLLITDGLERDAGSDLAAEMDRLHRSCRRLIWLNPLLGFDGFAARARGIRTMLPHVDEFRSIHSVDAVADLCRALSGDAPAADPRRWLAAA